MDAIDIVCNLYTPKEVEEGRTRIDRSLLIAVQNVFIGTDAHSPKYLPPGLVRYMDSYGRHKVIFGTDFPVLDFERARSEIEELGLHAESLECVLRTNVERVYGL